MKLTGYQSGQAVIVVIMFLVFVSIVLVVRSVRPAVIDNEAGRALLQSQRAAVHADAGLEDVTYRVRKAMHYDNTEVLAIDEGFATTTVTDVPAQSLKIVRAAGDTSGRDRFKTENLQKGDKVTFNYALQAGNGGFSMENSSSVIGNVYSNGTVIGSGNLIKGSVVSAGPAGLLNSIHATSSVWAHTITNATVDKDAYYQVISGSTVGGVSYPGSPDKPPAPFPISDSQIAAWEQDAAAGGTYSGACPYQIKSSVTIGPLEVPCDMEISNNASVTFAGPVWVVGNINFKNSSAIRLDPSLLAKSISVIADNPLNRSTASLVTISNSTTFQGSGTPGSFFFLISANNSSESGGSTVGIYLQNSAQGPVVLYTNHGKVSIANSSQLKSVTGYLINIKNSAVISYDDGLESSLFDTGPGGSWNVVDWKETQ